MLRVIDLSLILFNSSWGIYSIPKESNYKAVLLSITNETQGVDLLCLSLRFMTFALSFILDKLPFKKTPLNLGSYLKYLVISILLKGWSRTKICHPCDKYYIILLLWKHIFQLSWLHFQLAYFLTLKHLKFLITYQDQEIHLLIF